MTGSACAEPERPAVGLSTSGPYVEAGQMAADDVAGDAPGAARIVVVAEHSNEAAPAIGAAERFVAMEGLVAVVGHSNSAASLAAAPIYNGARVAQLAPHSSAVLYREAGPFSFRMVPGDDLQGEFLAARLLEHLPGGGRVAVLYVNDDYGRGLRASLRGALDPSVELAVEIPHIEGPVTEEDLTRTAEELRPARADALVWLGRSTVLAAYLPVLRTEAGPVPILGSDAVAPARQLPEIDDSWRGVWFIDFLDMAATEPLRRFAARYQERFARQATGPDALTYDAITVVLAGIESGARTGDDMRRFLLSLGRERAPFQGITGPVAFDEQGEVDRPYVLRPVLPEPPG
jgi:branched-chain amino acid transport system substrate-binding protein